MFPWVVRITLAVLVAYAPVVAAQETQAPWRLSYFPYLTVSPNDGLMGIARVLWFRQAGWDERYTLANSVALEAGYSTRDAWLARATWANPAFAEGWRMMAHAEVGHEPRFGDPDASFERTRGIAWVDVTRKFTDKVYGALRGGARVEEWEIGDAVNSDGDVTVRGAVVVDLRDREFEVNRGVLLEGGVIFGTGGAEGYRALYGHARGWYNPLPYLRLTGRFGWRQPVDRGSSASAIEFPGWEGDFIGTGGHRSHRGLGTGQLMADGFSFAGAEARFDILNVGEMGALTVFAFADGARRIRDPDVFCGIGPCTGFDSHDDWHWGGGGGIALRVLRSATLTISAAGGDGETRWYIGSGWSW
jgi:hypothetical protein